MHHLGLQILVGTDVDRECKSLKGMNLWGILYLTTCFGTAEIYLVFVISPADGSLRGECAQEEKDRDQMGSSSPKSCLISRSVQTPHTEGARGVWLLCPSQHREWCKAMTYTSGTRGHRFPCFYRQLSTPHNGPGYLTSWLRLEVCLATWFNRKSVNRWTHTVSQMSVWNTW